MNDLSNSLNIYYQLLALKLDNKKTTPYESYDIRNKNTNIEGEIRYSDIDYLKFKRTFGWLKSYGFEIVKEDYNLKISLKENPLRIELNGLKSIQNYCISNELPSSSVYMMKEKFNEYKNYYKNDDFGFRFSIQKESYLNDTSEEVLNTLRSWNTLDKYFRFMKRYSLVHKDYPNIRVDFSIVKSSPSYIKKFENVFEQNESYEIEIELEDNIKVFKTFEQTKKNINKIIKYICEGIQNSVFPIPKSIVNSVLQEYLGLTKIKTEYISSRQFIGPSSYTLQKKNLLEDTTNECPSILNDFCVTDKADGDRKLLFITSKGFIYLIDTNMSVTYTGLNTKNSDCFSSLIDGEHISNDKFNSPLNLYASFDIYYIKGKDYRNYPFYTDKEKKGRYDKLKIFIKILNNSLIVKSELNKLVLQSKEFYMSSDVTSIFECCEKLFKKIEEDQYPYETDGLILSSMSLGVGKESPVDDLKNYKYTWGHSFKWKPPEFNTIDFFVEIKQTEKVNETVYLPSNDKKDIMPYNILNLYIGYDVKNHGLLEPQKKVFEGVQTNKKVPYSYTKELFKPTHPIDNYSHICYIPCSQDTNQNNILYAENKDIIENEMIVEFKYTFNEDKRLSWVPIRVRYDKTYEYKKTKKQFGNSFHVANSNWYSIHNPVTKEMITQNKKSLHFDIFEEEPKVYYNRSSQVSYTENLRKFHNKYVKKMLYDKLLFEKCNIIDYAVGKGGDIHKWLKNKCNFVLGIDISRDNIHNSKDGVCVRYLEQKKINKKMFNGLFICGDTSKQIMNYDFVNTNENNKEDQEISTFVIEQLFSHNQSSTKYGKYIESLHGISKDLFDVGTIQFAVHYMFKNKYTFHSFLKNLSDTIKVGGTFIGTCYDGEKVFTLLQEKQTKEKIELFKEPEDNMKDTHIINHNEKRKIWSIEKKYNKEEFSQDETSLGYTIGVYQESINQEFEEYLVNFPYFIETLKHYGFEVENNIPDTNLLGIGNFKDLYEHHLQHNDAQYILDDKEKQISFLNKYFIFRKKRQVNSTLTYNGFIQSNEKERYLHNISKPKKINKSLIIQ